MTTMSNLKGDHMTLTNEPNVKLPELPAWAYEYRIDNPNAAGLSCMNLADVLCDYARAAIALNISGVDAQGAAGLIEAKRRLDGLRELCGYVEDGSCQFVSIGQDDASRAWCVSIGRKHYASGPTFVAAIDAALAALAEGEEEHDRKWANYGTPVDETKVANVEGGEGQWLRNSI